jgi:pSer/pThr/pTyr-binding forkhead associated (FHA) protein
MDGDRLTLGTSPQNDLTLEDEMASRLHAVLEHYASGWAIRDLGSRNGTYVNGERLVGERALRPGDEIRVGDTRLVYRADVTSDTPTATRAIQAPPELTRRERDVILELCRPVLGGSLLTEPATVREIASALVVTESAVKKHLGRLFDKFELHGDGERRRGRLAAEAIKRGAVGFNDVRLTPPG